MKTICISLLMFSGCYAAELISREQAEALVKKEWSATVEKLATERAAEMKEKSITVDGKTLRFLEKTFGEIPAGGRPLVISMHGGGGAPAAVNDQQWQNQIMLYQPEGSLYIAPRAPTDTWNLWHEAHVDVLLDRLIADCIAIHKINPDRVYLMGYSAGGDGVYQLGPRMADRWAAVAMMAGHPNESQPASLRNLPFALQVGGQDAAFKRNEITKTWADQLDALEKKFPGDYEHFFKSYPECGHWMKLQDAVAVPWMLKHTRKAWPKVVTWLQDDVLATRFYWLSVNAAEAKAGQLIDAVCEKQTIAIQTDAVKTITLRLSDQLLNLDQEITVTWNGKEVFKGKIERSAAAIAQSIKERQDPSTIATALLEVKQP